MLEQKVQYVSDEEGKLQSVIVPIELWREVLADQETAYLLKSDVMRNRLLAAMKRQEGISFEDARAKLGI
jgi:PHD/YefM family antitoxin component YafN of YafNO toxin-antitoxin module